MQRTDGVFSCKTSQFRREFCGVLAHDTPRFQEYLPKIASATRLLAGLCFLVGGRGGEKAEHLPTGEQRSQNFLCQGGTSVSKPSASVSKSAMSFLPA